MIMNVSAIRLRLILITKPLTSLSPKLLSVKPYTCTVQTSWEISPRHDAGAEVGVRFPTFTAQTTVYRVELFRV